MNAVVVIDRIDDALGGHRCEFGDAGLCVIDAFQVAYNNIRYAVFVQ